MPFQLIRGDITKISCDAIVNAADGTLCGSSGVCGAIHKAAGPELQEACRRLGGCETGQAKITEGCRLPCQYVIHTVGPIWFEGCQQEEQLLRACYQNCLEQALQHQCRSIAFPLISSGAYGCPREKSQAIAVEVIASFLEQHEMLIYLVLYTQPSGIARDRELQRFLAAHYQPLMPGMSVNRDLAAANAAAVEHKKKNALFKPMQEHLKKLGRKSMKAQCAEESCESEVLAYGSLENQLAHLDESFTQMLLRLIDERGMTDAECYKRANIDRRLFSKIRCDLHYTPKKKTAIAFAIALELSLEETKDLLMKAGYALSRSNRFDVIVEYYISRKKYDIFEINQTLFEFDEVLIGA
ncbi:MAG: macro domain-containing protein [Oscillospiraceae bacterium]|nr:macro domain-containing protein [Oscillospiraceae bacterium]